MFSFSSGHFFMVTAGPSGWVQSVRLSGSHPITGLGQFWLASSCGLITYSWQEICRSVLLVSVRFLGTWRQKPAEIWLGKNLLYCTTMEAKQPSGRSKTRQWRITIFIRLLGKLTFLSVVHPAHRSSWSRHWSSPPLLCADARLHFGPRVYN